MAVTNAQASRDISNDVSLVNAKIVNANTKTEADSKVDTGSIEGNFKNVYYQFEVKSDSPVSVGDYFDINIATPTHLTMPAELRDEKGEVFATLSRQPATNDAVLSESVQLRNLVYRYTVSKDVDSFSSSFNTSGYTEYRVLDSSLYPEYPINETIGISVGDDSYSTNAEFSIANRFFGISEQLNLLYNDGLLNPRILSWVSESTTLGESNGLAETILTYTIPEDSPLVFPDATTSPYRGIYINEWFNKEGDPDIRVDSNTYEDPEFLSKYIALKSSSDKERVYVIQQRDSGGNPFSYHFDLPLLLTDTSFLNTSSTPASVLEEYPNLKPALVATSNDALSVETSKLSFIYDKPWSYLGVHVRTFDANAEVKKINIVEKDNNGVYQYLQVKDIDTGELVPVSEYEIKDSILPQIPGTQLVSKDIFTRLGGGYEVATPYTEVQDPMTTVLVKRVLFNTVLNAVLEDGTVIKQKWVSGAIPPSLLARLRLLEMLPRN